MKFRGIILSLAAFVFSSASFANTLNVIDAYIKYLPANSTYAVDVSFNPSQFRSLYNSGKKIEFRYYAAKRDLGKELARHNMPKLGEYTIQNNRNATASYTLSKREICPEAGHYVAKVWFDVRNADGSNDASYDKNEFQGSYAQVFPYTCFSDNASAVTFDRGHFPEFNIGNDGKQLNFKAWIDQDIFNSVMSRNGSAGFELTFYAFKDGQRIRLYENKTYKTTQQKLAYTLSANELCEKTRSYWNGDVDVGLEMAAIHSDGNPSWSFTPFVTAGDDRMTVTCR